MDKKLETNVKSIIFDLDETLIDAVSGLEAACDAVSKRLCDFVSIPDGKSAGDLSKLLWKFNRRMNKKKNYQRNSWWPKFVKEHGFEGELDRNQVRELTEIYWSAYREASGPYPATKKTLQYLSDEGYLLGILTDTDATETSKRKRIEPFDFTELMDTIVIAGLDTENTKPHPEPYRLVTSNLDLDVSECAMVGDKPFTDIEGAESAGMVSILIRRRDWSANANPDFTIESLKELKKIF